ncbi:octopamine receptor Oamb-like [Actinia tenebrosa]|uniref:Octopamine receptor Oamb-like n=1 Tax=Actinia tenebrosa TaxID=6105 RepID=A0A6P8HKV7_ACTTE|nr:octopamine receptor Oamb-like [Actinia tenebrosa]
MQRFNLYPPSNATEVSICEDDQLGVGLTISGLIFMYIIITLSILGNILVCSVIFKYTSLQTVSYYLVCSLAVSDMMVSVTVVPFDIVYWIYFPVWPLGGLICNLWNSVFFLFLMASVFNLLAISTDRFIAIVYPLRYKELMSFNVVKVIIAFIWTYSIITGIILFLVLIPPEKKVYSFELPPAFHAFLLVVNVLIPFLIMIGFYFKIYVIARRHAKRVGIISNIPTDIRNVGDLIGRELRVAKALGIVVITFVLCWLPFEIINIAILIDEGIENCAMEIADTLSCWLAYLQTAVNPIIYAFSNTKFRKAFKKILFKGSNDSFSEYRLTTVHRQQGASTIRISTVRNTSDEGQP